MTDNPENPTLNSNLSTVSVDGDYLIEDPISTANLNWIRDNLRQLSNDYGLDIDIFNLQPPKNYSSSTYIEKEYGTLNGTIRVPDEQQTIYRGTSGYSDAIGSQLDDILIATGFGFYRQSIGEKRNRTLIGNSGDDIIVGSFGDYRSTSAGTIRQPENGMDAIEAGMGNDTIFGNRGDDTLDGGEGNDKIYGGYENDLLFGRDGDDYLDGGWHNDTLDGGEGNDYLLGGLGIDQQLVVKAMICLSLRIRGKIIFSMVVLVKIFLSFLRL